MVEKIAYVMANPVAAGLVKRAADWLGVRTLPQGLGRSSLQAKRLRCTSAAPMAPGRRGPRSS